VEGYWFVFPCSRRHEPLRGGRPGRWGLPVGTVGVSGLDRVLPISLGRWRKPQLNTEDALPLANR
jgi:hypothetical protein